MEGVRGEGVREVDVSRAKRREMGESQRRGGRETEMLVCMLLGEKRG